MTMFEDTAGAAGEFVRLDGRIPARPYLSSPMTSKTLLAVPPLPLEDFSVASLITKRGVSRAFGLNEYWADTLDARLINQANATAAKKTTTVDLDKNLVICITGYDPRDGKYLNRINQLKFVKRGRLSIVGG